jgi:Ca2+-binding RTX toxin-like protein
MNGRLKVAVVAATMATGLLAVAAGAPADSVPTCLGEKATIVGTEGDDLLAGTSKDDVIVGLGGNDVINAHDGDDLVCGGDGNDRIDAGDGFFDGIDGGAGDDWIDGGDAALTIAIYKDAPGPVAVDLSARTASGDGTDILANVNSVVGSDFDDVLTGDSRMNLIAGEDGNDTIKGGSGGDLVSGDAGDDTLDGGPGRDVAMYYDSPVGVVVNLGTGKAVGWGTDRLSNFEDIDGSKHADRLLGSGGVNRLEGEGGADRLIGLGANDVLNGNGGRDYADGGRGRDRCAAERRIRCP